jgi:hypothetical protein
MWHSTARLNDLQKFFLSLTHAQHFWNLSSHTFAAKKAVKYIERLH